MLLALVPALLLAGCEAAPTRSEAAANGYPALTGRVVDPARGLSRRIVAGTKAILHEIDLPGATP